MKFNATVTKLEVTQVQSNPHLRAFKMEVGGLLQADEAEKIILAIRSNPKAVEITEWNNGEPSFGLKITVKVGP